MLEMLRESSYALYIAGLYILMVADFIYNKISTTRGKKKSSAEQERVEKRAAIRAEEARHMMSMMIAISGLSMATAKCIKGERINGEMDKAMEAVAEARREYFDFINGLAIDKIAKV